MADIAVSFFIITLVNVLVYIWAYKKQSDQLTDISYSLCFIAATLYFLLGYRSLTPGRLALALMVIIWGVRLGGFLFYRIQKMGQDKRFDTFRGDPAGFLKFWLLQSLSICIIVLPVIFGLMADDLTVNVFALATWAVGWIIQSVADWQKLYFKSHNPGDHFISYGLYTYVRHPNYTGEILIWVSVLWYVAPALSGWQWMAVISPLWVIVLLTRISGIPLVENLNRHKYTGNDAYAKYVARTWRLVPFLY